MEKRKNIALCIGMLETDFSRNICEGALLGAKDINANLIVLPGGIFTSIDPERVFDVYHQQYNILYSYASKCSFDAIIVEYGTVTSELSEEEKTQFLKQMGDTPVILLAGAKEGYSDISINNNAGIKEAVAHLIEEHKCTKIGFVSGRKTNQDANERLQAYLETMREHNLEVPERWIAYGDFTEYYEEPIEELISNNRDLEAIVFANDQMAMSGYKIMKRLQIKPKEDIRVIGFDDNPIAMLLEPYLSSVKLDPKEIGYRAVLACSDVLAGKEVHQSVKSSLIARESCGCGDSSIIHNTVKTLTNVSRDELAQHFADDIYTKYISVFTNEADKKEIQKNLCEYYTYFFNMIQEDGSLDWHKEEFERKYRKYMQICKSGYISIREFLMADQMLYNYLNDQISHKDDKLCLMEQIMTLRRQLISSIATHNTVMSEKNRLYEPIMASIVSDMLYYATDESRRYQSVIDKLKIMEYKSSCIIMYDKPIQMHSSGQWVLPEHFYVKAHHDMEQVDLFTDNEKEVEISKIFRSQWVPSDRRADMLAVPLFLNQNQYGIFLIEADVDFFQYAIEIACQISVAIEVVEILNKQNEIKNELENNLAKVVESNRMLDEISRKDPLTGMLNRRGFWNDVQNIISDEKNYGKRAMVVYADMDNLKIVNDEFGHDEGDYALKLIAKALSNSFRKTDIIARMGGDEFAAFGIVNQKNVAQIIKDRIYSVLNGLNCNNGKTYYVGMSVGIAEFIIEESVKFENIVTVADQNLYIEKKSKHKIIYKSEIGME